MRVRGSRVWRFRNLVCDPQNHDDATKNCGVRVHFASAFFLRF